MRQLGCVATQVAMQELVSSMCAVTIQPETPMWLCGLDIVYAFEQHACGNARVRLNLPAHVCVHSIIHVYMHVADTIIPVWTCFRVYVCEALAPSATSDIVCARAFQSQYAKGWVDS